jgi:hypothetical protein
MNPCRKLVRTEEYIICLEEAKEYMRRSRMTTVEFWWHVTRETTTAR